MHTWLPRHMHSHSTKAPNWATDTSEPLTTHIVGLAQLKLVLDHHLMSTILLAKHACCENITNPDNRPGTGRKPTKVSKLIV